MRPPRTRRNNLDLFFFTFIQLENNMLNKYYNYGAFEGKLRQWICLRDFIFLSVIK